MPQKPPTLLKEDNLTLPSLLYAILIEAPGPLPLSKNLRVPAN